MTNHAMKKLSVAELQNASDQVLRKSLMNGYTRWRFVSLSRWKRMRLELAAWWLGSAAGTVSIGGPLAIFQHRG